ncbi:calcium-dependent phosphotriesterase [Penicillium chermesinum]|uniref:Calcium-dependent phosphotriesterase n=1 Tax=Penicillium chermesinum TaxID=63820 RepID=A0A9W9PGR0_9EURO|nr:calcium-dependent phosphotriesterase [Penicillium chermesinum]KAJ5246556.1 calcium-dependent phosphotriesterase [Penicillium chermesinum]
MANPQPKSSPRLWTWAVIILGAAVFYRQYVHEMVTLILGTNRVIQPIKTSHGTVVAFLDSRMQWLPSADHLNFSGKPEKDHIVVLDIDEPGADGLYGWEQAAILAHQSPPPRGLCYRREILDPVALGANSTVEVFDLAAKSNTLSHVKIIASDASNTPNNLAVDADGNGFFVTNDHTDKVAGLVRELRGLIGSGSLAYCQTDTGECRIATDEKCYLPNGLVRGHDGRYYVVHSMTAVISVHEYVDDELTRVDEIPLGVPVDNLSVDHDGNIIAAAVPDVLRFVRVVNNPYDNQAPAAVLSIQRKDSGYEVVK